MTFLVTGSTREEQSQSLKNAVQRLQKFGLRLNEAECKFFQKKLEFLGHVVIPSGIHPTDQRVDNILKVPTPTCKSQLKSFLGLMTYNAKFLPSVASVLYPLYQLRTYFEKTLPGSGPTHVKRLLKRPKY